MSNDKIPALSKQWPHVLLKVVRATVLCRKEIARPRIVTARSKRFAAASRVFAGD